MANPENVLPYGVMVHDAAACGGPEAYLKEFGLRLLELASPEIYSEGYSDGYADGDKDGMKKGLIVTIAAFIIWQAVDKVPKWYRKHKQGKDDIGASKAYIERLLHLDKYVAEVANKYDCIKKYNVNGRVIRLVISDSHTDSDYEADIVFTNDGNYRYDTCKEDDLTLQTIARDIQRLLNGKYVYVPNETWISRHDDFERR